MPDDGELPVVINDKIGASKVKIPTAVPVVPLTRTSTEEARGVRVWHKIAVELVHILVEQLAVPTDAPGVVSVRKKPIPTISIDVPPVLGRFGGCTAVMEGLSKVSRALPVPTSAATVKAIVESTKSKSGVAGQTVHRIDESEDQLTDEQVFAPIAIVGVLS